MVRRWKNQFLHSSYTQIWRRTKHLLRSLPFQPLRAWRAYPVPWTASVFIQGIVPLQEKSHYVLHHLTSALASPVLIQIFTGCSAWIQVLSHVSALTLPFQTSPKSPGTHRHSSYLSYTQTTLCATHSYSMGLSFSLPQQKPQKAAPGTSSSICKALTKTFPTHF